MKVLMTTDGHEPAVHAMRTALKLLSREGLEVRLLSVLDPTQRIGGNENADDDLAQGLAVLADEDVTAKAVERRGDFATEILAEATEMGADVIVLGSAGHGRLVRWITGSVIDTVLKKWKGATLVVQHP